MSASTSGQFRVIGITGTIGAGKGSIVELLTRRHGFAHYSVRDYLSDLIRERGMPLVRETMRTVANELRAQHGAAHIVDTLCARAFAEGREGSVGMKPKMPGAIIESVRTVGEVRALRSHGATLIAVDAEPRLRYNRIVSRASETGA